MPVLPGTEWLWSMTIMPDHPLPENNTIPDPLAAVELGPLPGLIGYALRRAQLALFQDFQRQFAADEIRPVQFSVLAVLQQNPGLRATQVALALGIKRTNFVPLLDVLEARGLAERRRVKGDRRASALFLTPAGTALLERLMAMVDAHEARFAARLGAGGKMQLLSLLQRLTDPAFDPS